MNHYRLAQHDSAATRRQSTTTLAVFATIVIVIAIVIAAAPRLARATSCVMPPSEGPMPDHVRDWARRLASAQPENPGGYERLAAQLRENRKALREGRITREEAEATGGLALTGTRRFPVLPVLYSNSGDDPINPDALELQLFAPFLPGSMHNYYLENSYDQFTVEGTVFGYERVSAADTYYDGVDNGLSGGAALLVLEALPLFDPYVNFALYDNDGPDGIANSGDDDGMTDIAFVMHPEIGAECSSAGGMNIWSHHWWLTQAGLDPFVTNDARAGGGWITVDRYCVTPSLNCNGAMIEIGVFCHEFGHALGIKDLYDTDGGSNGIGFWGLMAAGSWNTPSSPGHMSAFEKEQLGWLNYFNVTSDQNLCLPPVETSPVAARVWSNGAESPQYFLVENRQRLGFDAQLMGNGLVIYHVDEAQYTALYDANDVNADEAHKAIDVECADATTAQHVPNADDLDDDGTGGNRGDADDVWCLGGTQRTFFPFSTPDSRAYGDDITGVWVKDVGACNGNSDRVVCAEYRVGVQAPLDLCVNDCPNDNCNNIALCTTWWGSPDIWVDNNEDGFSDMPASGIENKVWFRVKNLGPDDAAGAKATLYITPGAMGIEWPADASYTVGTKTMPLIAAGETYTDYFVFEYPELFDLVGHYCMGLVLTHANDQVASQSASLSNNIAQINHQVLVQRAGGPGPQTASCSGAFDVASKVYLYSGDGPDRARVEVRLGSPPNFTDAVIPAGWSLTVLPTGARWIEQGQRDSITVRVTAANATHGQSAHVPLTLWNILKNKAVDGIVVDFTVDCVEPAQPMFAGAAWRVPLGDAIPDPAIQVSWGSVFFDVNGGAEVLEHYEVYRSDNHGGAETLIDRVAIDDEPDQSLFQWYDTSVNPTDCPIVYTYRVRAIDAAGNAGAFSAPGSVACPATGVASASASPSALAIRAFPNPFGTKTSIAFTLSTASDVDVSIFDVAGQRVRQLAKGAWGAGAHVIEWDGADGDGRSLASGIYFYRVQSGALSETRKLVLSR